MAVLDRCYQRSPFVTITVSLLTEFLVPHLYSLPMSNSQPQEPSIFISTKQISELRAFAEFTGIPAEQLLHTAIEDWIYFNGPVIVGDAPARRTAHILRFPGNADMWEG